MFRPMKNTACLLLTVISATIGFTSCAEEVEKKPVGPVSETSSIPWNTQIPGQGQGQLGMMPQNQYRR
jgi:hypothetical protein